MKVELDIQSCRECPHSTNNVREHDDPFTSSPAEVIWYCTKPNGPRYIQKASQIHERCPLKAANQEKN